MSIGNHEQKFIDPGFAELRFAMVLRLPWLRQLAGSEEPGPDLSVRARP
jgi:hypothetical protein